jgi:hypothetical protein
VCSLCLLNACGGSGGGGTGPSTAATHFAVTVPATATVGTAFSFTVTALDSSNNVAATYSGTVHFTSSDAQAAIPANSMLTNGAGTFSVTLKTAAAQTITATDTVMASIAGTSNSITVSGSSGATHFSVTAPATATAGTGFSFTVTALDASNNTVASYSGMVAFSSSDPQAVLPANSTLTQGTGGFSVTLKTTGPQTITATDSATHSITGTSTSISVSALTSLTITSGAPPSGTVGSNYSGSSKVCRGTMCSFTGGFQLMGSGGVSPYTWTWAAATGSSLPPGLGLSTAAFIGGQPTTAGAYNVVVTLTDSETPPAHVNASYTINVAANAPGAVTVSISASSESRPGEPPKPVTLVWSSTNATSCTASADPSESDWSGSEPTSGSAVVSPVPEGHSVTYMLICTGPSGSASASVAESTQCVVGPCRVGLTASMETPRLSHTATLLKSGKVLVAEGGSGAADVATAELFDPTTKKFAQTNGRPTMPRTNATATLLSGGKVLITGGQDENGELATADLYDPTSETFAATTGAMSDSRAYHTATLLNDGTVLVAGGLNLAGDASGIPVASAEIYDPATDSFTLTGAMTEGRYFHTATLLANGMVLVTGGLNEEEPIATAEIYDPSTKTFTATGTMTTARMGHTATLLGNHEVLVAGGAGAFGGSATSATELFDPTAGTFTPANAMTSAHCAHTATLLQNGQVLIAGGANFFYGSGQSNSISSVELYDPTTGYFTATADMTAVRESHTATLLNSGEVLVVGGSNGTLGFSTTTTVLSTAEVHQ